MSKKIIPFSKMHGLGNDFVIIDNLRQQIKLSNKEIQFLGDRHFGIGFDQLLMIEASEQTHIDFKYRIFNNDGNEVEQCGNGARCFAHYVHSKKLSNKNPILVETQKSIIELYLIEHDDELNIQVDMGTAEFYAQQIPINLSSQQDNYYQITRKIAKKTHDIDFYGVSLGNPHITIIVDDVKNFPVESWGKTLSQDSIFPKGINIGFMQIIDAHNILLRVFERGVGETLACGSGACAAVVNGIKQGILKEQVTVQLPGGKLQISWPKQQHIIMSGGATHVFDGTIEL